MAEKNELLEKRLNKNYLNVQKKEIEGEEYSDTLLSKYSKHKSTLSDKLKAEQKEIKALNKDIKEKYRENLLATKEAHKENLDEIAIKLEAIKEKNIAGLQQSASKHDSDIIKLDKAIDNLLKEQQKQVINIEKQYKANISLVDKEIAQINSKATSDIADLEKKFNEMKKQHEANVLVLSQDKEEEVKRISDAANKKIKSMTNEMNKEEKILLDDFDKLKENLSEKYSKLENSIVEVKNLYEELTSAMKSTLESKIERHQKFIDKSIKDNDPRAIKLHKKEIEMLNKESEKELKQMKLDNIAKLKELEILRKAMVIENLELIAAKEKELVLFKEEKLYEIELEKASKESAISIVRLPTSQSLQDELSSFNAFERDYLTELANIKYSRDLAIENKNHEKFKLDVEFEKVSDINKIRHFEEEVKAKELKVIEIDKTLADDLLKLSTDIEMAKLELESNISEKRLEKEELENAALELKEYNNTDLESQKKVAKEYQELLEGYKALYEDRAAALIAFEELEINNRNSLKITFLESKFGILSKEHSDHKTKIENSFELEKAYFEEKREKAVAEELKELAEFVAETEAIIKKLVKKRDSLDPKVNKVEYRDLDIELTNVRDKFDSSVKSMKASIASKTALYDSGLNSALARKELALAALNTFYDNEIAAIKEAIEIANNHKDYELMDTKERKSKIANNCELLLTKLTNVTEKTNEDIGEFNDILNQNQTNSIKDANDLFDKQVFSLKANIENVLSNLEQQKEELISKSKQDINAEEQVLECKIAEFNLGVSNVENASQKVLDKQEILLNQNKASLEQTLKSELSKISNTYSEKETMYKRSMSEIDKVTSEELKKLENIKKTIKKDYDTTVQKQIAEISSKLQLDLKSAN